MFDGHDRIQPRFIIIFAIGPVGLSRYNSFLHHDKSPSKDPPPKKSPPKAPANKRCFFLFKGQLIPNPIIGKCKICKVQKCYFHSNKIKPEYCYRHGSRDRR